VSLSSPITIIGPTIVTGYYESWYLLTAKSDPLGIVDSSKWYKAGVTVTLSCPSRSQVQGLLTYSFLQWELDGVRLPANTIGVAIDYPVTATARYEFKLLPDNWPVLAVILLIVVTPLILLLLIVSRKAKRKRTMTLTSSPLRHSG